MYLNFSFFIQRNKEEILVVSNQSRKGNNRILYPKILGRNFQMWDVKDKNYVSEFLFFYTNSLWVKKKYWLYQSRKGNNRILYPKMLVRNFLMWDVKDKNYVPVLFLFLW